MDDSPRKRKILVVEDDKLLLKICRIKLEQEDFEVVTALDGEEGLKLVEKERPDLVLLDIVMPKKNGLEVLEVLKSRSDLKAIPVIVFSNLSNKADVKKALSLGALEYFIKTDISLDLLVSKIRKYLG